ncbi:hypothetical protein Cgig2_022994 [Carnegiea gigantea]|uniref:ENTH domain-containing protein n=1 Tax=Carnegiea gigantea TaxID=171969 RepID=A0A9Q1JPY6_9CARY|nr:hypothetical protein Cgig2_022994 [Carnegiea gigantea]
MRVRATILAYWLKSTTLDMSVKKAFDQTIRDIKREVNKKVLKVPSIEQKVLDATSNEPWGPHGSLLADIAQASRNYHEYPMIMSVIWKRINDTGKNWRHVYKALTVLEYLVAHGSERVIDEIREHAYQISTLSDFQYIDSSGRDQGNNVRRKSQSLVLLVNDKERIQEARQKAASNRDKFRSTSAVGGMYRPSPYSGSGGYGDDGDEVRYGGREDERNGYGREREWGYRDEERYGRNGDSYNCGGDRYRREADESYARDSYRDDDSRGRRRSFDGERYGSRSRSSDRYRGRVYDDDDHHSSRGSSVRGEDWPQDGRPLERKFSEQYLSAPPSYEEAVGDLRSPAHSDRGGETPAASAPQSSSPTANAAPQSLPPSAVAPQSLASRGSVKQGQATAEPHVLSHPSEEADHFDEFDPRGSVPAAQSTSNNAEMDLLGSLSKVLSPNPLAIMPASSGTANMEADKVKAAPIATFTTATSENNILNQASAIPASIIACHKFSPLNLGIPGIPNRHLQLFSDQSFEDPFGDTPFKATPSDELPAQPHVVSTLEQALPVAQKAENANPEFAHAFPSLAVDPKPFPNAQTVPTPQFASQVPQSLQDDDILAGILPPSGTLPSTASQAAIPSSTGVPLATFTAFAASTGLPAEMGSQAAYPASPSPHPAVHGFMPQSGLTAASFPHTVTQNLALPLGHAHQHCFPCSAPSAVVNPSVRLQAQSGTLSHQQINFLADILPQGGSSSRPSSQSAPLSSADSLALVPGQPAKQKFDPKSAVWADTLSRGLVNLDISGPKTNPMADLGIDFESLNRKEKRMEKSNAAPSTPNVIMGKAMGSGSGIGRAGAGALRPTASPMMGSAMGTAAGMAMGGGPGVGVGMVGYGSMSQQPMGMSMSGMGISVGGMGRGMGRGAPMHSPNGLAPWSDTNSYNPMMGRGGYPQQPYGGGY